MSLVDFTYGSMPFYELALTEVPDLMDGNILRGCWGLDDFKGMSYVALMETYGVSKDHIIELAKSFSPIFHKLADWWRD
jgi:hypothetical protein